MNSTYPVPPDFPVYIPPPERGEQDTFQQFNQRQDETARISKQLDIASWVAINQIVPLPIETWLGTNDWQDQYGLSDAIKRAIIKEVEEVARQRQSAHNEAQRKFEMEKAVANTKLQFPRDPGSTTAHLFK
ncbi:hypothetical protein ACQ4M3_19095 [Leptolyngbya sp. AN03gr2]|uniref:hypothetical protein n=1 Tax=Leptolyngbya sp. AN03gr2 TaxID=3423364 RepID=UPI003D3107F5